MPRSVDFLMLQLILHYHCVFENFRMATVSAQLWYSYNHTLYSVFSGS